MTAKTVRCACSAFEFGTFEIDQDNDYSTECNQTTTRVFAQGHDAKLVGYLVRADMAGEEIRRNNGGVIHSFHGAVHAASAISEALAAKAQAQLDAARARIAKKAAREATKAARKSAKAAVEPEQPTTVQAKIKVGRWAYDATIDCATGDATYAKKLGGTQTISRVDYKVIESM
jgi:hypothetical protein